jgi:hypothetical protein
LKGSAIEAPAYREVSREATPAVPSPRAAIQFTTDLRMQSEVGSISKMRRAQAILLVAALFAAPLALLARSGACGERACCWKQCRLPKAHHAAAKDAGGEMACHHRSSPVKDCAMKSACSHTLDYGLASPLPPTVLQAAGVPLALNAARSGASTDPFKLCSGFVATPFEPPRS